MALLKSKIAMWVKLGTPEKKYGSEDTQWALDVVVTEAESRKWVKDGLAMKERFMDINGKEESVIKLKKNTHYAKSGDERAPVKVVDTYGQDVDANKIGNGSTVNVQYKVNEWEFGGRKGKSAELIAVQVVELVEYRGGSDSSAGDEFDFMAKEEVSLDEGLDLEDDVFE